jgi:hypothetical protein
MRTVAETLQILNDQRPLFRTRREEIATALAHKSRLAHHKTSPPGGPLWSDFDTMWVEVGEKGPIWSTVAQTPLWGTGPD